MNHGAAALVMQLLAVLAISTPIVACTSAARLFDDTAMSLGLEKQTVVGVELLHVLYWRDGGPNRSLHIYLDGDGTPELAARPAEDPTPRNALMLRLMALDPGPAVYVGRPCYHGLAAAAECSGDLWTTARYSERVVASTAGAIHGAMIARGYDRITLLGYSGGGTLAMLLAERLPETQAVVTIAANLDIEAWTDHHGHARLAGSLNPITRPPLRRDVVQRHYAGARDAVVPPSVTASGVRGPNATLAVVDGQDHACCWADMWPAILKGLAEGDR